MTYDGNRLVKCDDAVSAQPTYNGAHHFQDLADSAVEYEYDGNGNMTKDLNRDITSIEYNSLNLPGQITFSDDTKMKLTYDAAGNKLRAEYWTIPTFNPGGPIGPVGIGGGDEPMGGGIVGPILPPINQNDPQVVTDYCGNLIYRNDTLTMLLMEEGYVTFATSGTPTYHYYLKDHLGNVRIVMSQDGTVDQRNQYYPDGTLFGKQSTGGTVQPYKFGQKELERTLPLDEYDFGARWMDPVVGARFTTMDPLCEKYYSISPYAYCGGDPMNAVDPDGRFIISKEQAKKYPRLNLYLQKGIQGILKNPTIMKALRIAGRFTDRQIKEMLTYGKGPTVNVTQVIGNNDGYFDPEENSKALNISDNIVNYLESAEGFDADVALFLVGVTILHELAHYGDYLAGSPEGTDREDGDVFEELAYGKRIKRIDAWMMVNKYLNESRKDEKNEKNKDDKNNKTEKDDEKKG